MKKRIFIFSMLAVGMLASQGAFAGLFSKHFELLNQSKYHLSFDKTWQSTSYCNNVGYPLQVGPNVQAVDFSIDNINNHNVNKQCLWAGAGYRIFNSSNQYVGYLSINVSEYDPYLFSISAINAKGETVCSDVFGDVNHGEFKGLHC